MTPGDIDNIKDKPDLLTLKQAAKMLHVHTNTLRRWSDSGQIRVLRINSRGDRRYRLRDIEKYLKTFNRHTEATI